MKKEREFFDGCFLFLNHSLIVCPTPSADERMGINPMF
jgi:hypothetical protein